MGKPVLALVGGGHTHALLLKKIQKTGFSECRLLLISSARFTAYSGMLPGVISGHYAPEEAHIDLKTLAEDTGCELIEEKVVALDAEQKCLYTDSGQSIFYDLLSINTGSTQARVIEAPDCISIKPVAPFLNWLHQDLPERLNSTNDFQLVIVGAGAAGVEVAMALNHRFQKADNLTIHLIAGGDVVAGHRPEVQSMVESELANKNISVHKQFLVVGVTDNLLKSQNGEIVKYDYLILATSASPAEWPASSTLATSQNGFVRVNSFLQSVSHPEVFACGDISEFADGKLAKSGVYAVRQTPSLYENLSRTLKQQPLKAYRPQVRFLSLLSCADGRAIASKGWFNTRGRGVWLWKDWIDRRFMKQFPKPRKGSMKF